MPALDTSIEFLPAGAEDYIEVAIEIEFDFQPFEPAVMDVESPMVGPGCSASAEITEIRRKDGEPVCDALRAEVDAWWRRHGEDQAIEQAEDGQESRRRRMYAGPSD